ncbi:hypothetical protein Goari_004471 [Gossypium aridum]|uniref:Uncharacterized protein n=1 Tax=Gossypium aridum TaxID=34290 RepID=A0A7J8Y4E1_GOSAI|nr:hypothetical protein [Gossypium aridum]
MTTLFGHFTPMSNLNVTRTPI